MTSSYPRSSQRPRSRGTPRTPMTETSPEDILLTEDADLGALQTKLLENDTLNYSRDEAAALCTTLTVLRKNSIPPPMRFSVRTLTLLPPSMSDGVTPTEKCLEFLSQLSISSRDAASGLITSSLVAGRRSEAEDHGDVAFWVGNIDETRLPDSILERLNVICPGEMYLLQNEGGQMLTSLNMINPIELNASSNLHAAVGLLAKMEKVVEFRTVISEEDSLVLYICAGTFEGAWCGLMGLSVESD
ncbi:hypothetical protein DL93DRAFT_943581 [Clavulina sp. PMI_390]|nr:hypothetical protein DL93DRAFT_943581 [Clavulina sp. PMI_390]